MFFKIHEVKIIYALMSITLVFFVAMSILGLEHLRVEHKMENIYALGVFMILMFVSISFYTLYILNIYSKKSQMTKEQLEAIKVQDVKIKTLDELLKNTINSFENLIFVKDSEFRYIEFNKAFEVFTGLGRSECMGKTDYDIFDKETADFFREKDLHMLKLGVTQENSEWVTYPDGQEVYLYTSKSPLHDSNGNILGLVGNSFDMTEKKLLEKKLKDQEEMMIVQSRHAAMGEMISMIAHQWRQPISVIAMEINNILVDVELDVFTTDSLVETSKDILRQTQELSDTIEDFRDFFKPDKVKEILLMQDLVDRALSVVGKSLEHSNIKVKLEIPVDLKINTYARELMQVFINIIKNAKEVLVEKSISDAQITISAIQDKENTCINIKDNAGGIEESIIRKVFEPYFTTKGSKNGTGLGLYMSKTIIEKHLNGTLIASNKLDGACFEIRLQKDVKND